MKPHRFCCLLLAGCLLAAARGTAAQPLPPGFDDTFAAVSMNPRSVSDEPDAVVRLYLLRFELAGPGKATEKVRRAVTVLAADGRDHGELVVSYDKLRHLKKLHGRLRDAGGKVIRELKSKDLADYSAISDYSLYEDNRVRVARLYHDAYPYTVEFEYEIEYNGLVGWPTWYPQQEEAPVEYTSFEIDAPADLPVRYAARGMTLEPEVAASGARKTYRWAASLLPAYRPERYGPSWIEQAAAVHTGPAAFEVEGTRGDMSTWRSFGQWYYALGQGHDILPPEAVADVQRLIADAPDAREQVRRLYRYLQQKTRYVSIQLGLGGWQPFDAAYVHQRGYGDCKALTNYMLALLRAAGIEAFPALIRSGLKAPQVMAAFPSNQFNHVVLVVPIEGDTLWLECTSQTMPFGHVSASIEDRYALVVRPDGGELVRTPRSCARENRQIRRATVRLTPEGHATAEVETQYTGNQQDYVRELMVQRTGRDREQWLHRMIDLPSFEVLRVDYSGLEARKDSIRLPLALKLPRYAARTGTRLFLTPNLMERWGRVPEAMAERKQPVEFFPYAFSDVDTIRYELPAGFKVEAMAAPVALETSFGRYQAETVIEADGGLAYFRLLEINEPSISAEDYEAFRAYLRQVAQADQAQVVLVQKP